MKVFYKNIFRACCSATFIIAVLLSGCLRDKCPQDPALALTFTYQDVGEDDLHGTWMITTRSLERLADFSGVTKYTNRLDHLILLKDNNRCVYRTFEEYFPVRDSEDEDRRYIAPETNFSVNRRLGNSWYAWQPGGDVPFDGPFSSKERVMQGMAILNRLPFWTLMDLRNAKENSEIKPHFGERYRIQFAGDPWEFGRVSGRTWHLGEYDNHLRLWTWISPNSRVIFEKVSDLDLDLLIEKKFGRITNSVERFNGSV